MLILADSRRLAQPTAPRVHARVRSGVPISISISGNVVAEDRACTSERIWLAKPAAQHALALFPQLVQDCLFTLMAMIMGETTHTPLLPIVSFAYQAFITYR